MHCLRRVALRSAIAASKQFIPKTAATPLSVQTASKTFASNQTSFIAAKCFSQTARSQNVEETKGQEIESNEGLTPTEQAEQTEQVVQPDERVYSIYVGNLSFDVGEEQLATAFSKYGEVVKTRLPIGPRGPKGFGFIQFKTTESCRDAVANVDGTFWFGRRLRVSLALNNDHIREQKLWTKNKPTKTLFVGNMPYDTTDSELNALFRELPNVKAVRVAVDRATGWPRGFGHVDFATVADAEYACSRLSGVMLGNRKLTIDYATAQKAPVGGQAGREKPEERDE